MGPKEAEFKTWYGMWWDKVTHNPIVADPDFDWNDWVLVGSVHNAQVFVACPYPYILIGGVSKINAFLVKKKNLKVWLNYATSLNNFIKQHKKQDKQLQKVIERDDRGFHD